uniref:Phosphatidylethanolamine-binding protein n=1 Tax=Glossina brevipalpis TaxID=37001 RepID=A0A1A9W5Q3_9MUSC
MTFVRDKLFTYGLAYIEAKDLEGGKIFKSYNIIPDVLETIPPKFLEIIFEPNLKADRGTILTPTQAIRPPDIYYKALPNAYYTIMMIDPDVPSRSSPMFRSYQHWLIVNIPGDQLEKGDDVVEYIGPIPSKNTGLHRYVFILYKQPHKLVQKETRVPNNSGNGRRYFNASLFAKKHNLGLPIAANFFLSEWDEYVPVAYKQLAGNR